MPSIPKPENHELRLWVNKSSGRLPTEAPVKNARTMIKNKGIGFKLTFFILTSCIVIFGIIFTYNYLFSRRIIAGNISEHADHLSEATVNKIEIILRSVEEVPQTIAYFLEEASYDKNEIISLLHSVVQNNPEIYGATIAFEPYAFDKEVLYFAPYFYKGKDKVELTYIGSDTYRYHYWDWYQIPKELGHAVWSEPYYDEGGGNIIMSTYSVPFYKEIDGKRKFMGIITADISLSWLQDIVSSIKIGETGYGFLISKNGTFVTHPHKDLIMNETIFSIAESRQDTGLRKIGQDMIRENSGFVPFRSIVTGKKCWMAYAPLTLSGWSLAVLFPQAELMADIANLNKVVIVLGLAGLVFLLIVIVLISNSITRPLRVLDRTTRDIAKGNLDFELTPVKSKDEVGRLTDSFIYAKDALKKYIKELTETTAVKERMESELKVAHDIQMGILPKIFPPFPDKHEFDVYAVLKPAKEVGGDFYDFFFIDDDHFCFTIGDVSDKGVPAALFMAVTKTLIKNIAREVGGYPDEILNRVNKEICQDNDSCMFVTIFFAILNIKTGEIYYANAGHNPPLIIRQNEVEFLKVDSGTAIGILETAVYKRAKLTLGPSDAICMYTDGVTEAFNEKNEQFCEERLKKEATTHKKDSTKDLVDQILHEVKLFSQEVSQSDDITIMVLRYFSARKKYGQDLGKSKSFILRNDLGEIPNLAHNVREFGERNKLSDKIISELTLALEERVVNVISYAYQDSIGHDITINISLKDKDLILEVKDDGQPFNPLEVPEPDIEKPLEERNIGGLGIFLIKTLMDEVEYKRKEGLNILVMKKKIS